MFELAVFGGVNKPVWLMVPGTHAPAGSQATAQLTSLLLMPVCTFSWSGCEVVTLTSAGERMSCAWVELGDWMVTLADPLTEGSARNTAVTVTIAPLVGTWLGAMYLPLASMGPTVEFPLGIWFTIQFTEPVAFCTWALN
jgi:hypothetical protein